MPSQNIIVIFFISCAYYHFLGAENLPADVQFVGKRMKVDSSAICKENPEKMHSLGSPKYSIPLSYNSLMHGTLVYNGFVKCKMTNS
jgi:hypothetical protein